MLMQTYSGWLLHIENMGIKMLIWTHFRSGPGKEDNTIFACVYAEFLLLDG